MDETYLLNKRYVNKDVYKANKNVEKYLDEQSKFRQFIEDQNLDYDDIDPENDIDEDLIRNEKPLAERYQDLEKKEKRIQIRRNLEQGNVDFFKNYNQSNDLGSVNLREMKPMVRFTQEKRHLYHFDSRNRDKTLYPEQNSYKIILKKSYTNVIAVKLKSTEFTNSQQLIRNTPFSLKNNILKWQLGANGDTDDFSVYTTTLVPGNYSASQLSSLIQNSMNSVLRSNGKVNNFEVTIDVVSDLVTISSIDNITLSGPLQFGKTENTGVFTTTITLNYPNANDEFSIGQTFYISGSSSAGGIPSSVINGTHIITDITTSSISFVVNAISTSEVVDGGGNSVEVGKGLLFRIIFSESQSPYSVLGFPNQDTPYSSTVTNNIETTQYKNIGEDSERIIVPKSNDSTQNTVDYLNSKIYPDDKDPNDNLLNIDLSEYILSVGGNVRLSIKSVTLPSDNFSNNDTSEDNLYTVITCNLPHNLLTGDRIYIYNESNAENDTSDFNGFMPFIGLFGINLDDLTQSEQTELEGFVTELTNPQGLFVIVDTNFIDSEYKFKISVQYKNIEPIKSRIDDLIANNFYSTSKTDINYIENYLFGNIITTEVNQNLNLSGEKYVYMTSSIIGNDESTGDIDNIFAKIQLAASSGSNIFNAYIGGYKYFYDSPLPMLNEIDIQFYSNDGNLFEWYDNDHSFTLEITEAIQKIEGSGFSSQIGTKT